MIDWKVLRAECEAWRIKRHPNMRALHPAASLMRAATNFVSPLLHKEMTGQYPPGHRRQLRDAVGDAAINLVGICLAFGIEVPVPSCFTLDPKNHELQAAATLSLALAATYCAAVHGNEVSKRVEGALRELHSACHVVKLDFDSCVEDVWAEISSVS